ncbi:MAG: acetylornithine transaminase [Polyangiales bacterium]
MSKTKEMVEAAGQALVTNYRQPPLVLARGKGCELFDVEGKRYIDLYGGIAVSSLGHAHPRVVKALADHAPTLRHTSKLFFKDPGVRLAPRHTGLTTLTSGPTADGAPTLTRAFLCNSGTEAIEACLKLARRAAFLKGETRRTRFIAFHNAFHGRTLGALALTGTPKYWEGFGCDTQSVTHLPYGDLSAVRDELRQRPGETAAIFVEAVPGAGGVLPAPVSVLPGLRELSTADAALLIIDEVQTGIARTGAWFAFQREGIAPDAIALAKGLGGGVPIGAMLIREGLNEVLTPGSHGTTFGGNPLAAAAANAVLDVVEEEGLVARAETMGRELSQRLSALAARHPSLFEGERGVGLLRGLIMRKPFESRGMMAAARDRGVLLSAAGDQVVRFTPPLVITSALLEVARVALDLAAQTLSQKSELPKPNNPGPPVTAVTAR